MLVSDNIIIDLIGFFFLSLCGIWLIAWLKIRQATDNCEQLRRELEAANHVSQRMKNNCDQYRFEVEWLKAVSKKQSGTRFLTILKHWSRQERQFYGWFVFSDGTWIASDRTTECPRIPNHLSAYSNVIQKTELPECFGHLPEDIESLFLFPCDSDSQDSFLMIMSEIPSFATDCSGVETFTHLMQRTRCQRQEVPERTVDAKQEVEVELAKEMLEIRTLLDSEFQSPQEMMQGFLKKLASLTGYQWASLYLNDLNSSTDIQFPHFASGGIREDCVDAATWQHGEQIFINEVLDLTDSPVIVTTETILERDEEIPFHCGMVIPVKHVEETLGLLILTHSESMVPSHQEAQLVEWASAFLLQTLRREMSRADIAQQARRDALTNIANRGTFDQELKRFLDHSTLTQEPCSLVMIDVDHFKSFNDLHGHFVGDLVLKSVANALEELTQSLRVTDHALAARYGGEEFAIILPNVGHIGSMRIAEEIRKRIAQLQVTVDDETLFVTISLGVATSHDPVFQAGELIKQADKALYLAKKSGRDCVYAHEANDLCRV